MSKIISVSALLIVLQAVPGPAPVSGRAVETTAPPVEELVQAALARAPEIAALRSRIAAAREMVAPAGALPDPTLELMVQNIGFPDVTIGREPMSMIGPEVRQGLPYPGKRDAHRGAAQANVEVREKDLARLAAFVAAEVRVIYASIHAMDSEKRTLQAARELLGLLNATVAARYSVGAAEQEAVIKTQLESSRVAERQDDLAARRTALVAALGQLLDWTDDTSLGDVVALPPPRFPAGSWEDLALASSPEVSRMRSAMAAASARVEVARLDLKPDFMAGTAVGVRGSLDPVVSLRFGLELPMWKKEKQLPLLHAAEHELVASQAELAAAEAAVRSQVRRLTVERSRAEAQIRRYREAIVPQSSAAFDAARSAYLAGRGDFSTVVEDLRHWIEARAELARRERDLFVAWAELVAITGEEPSGQESSS